MGFWYRKNVHCVFLFWLSCIFLLNAVRNVSLVDGVSVYGDLYTSIILIIVFHLKLVALIILLVFHPALAADVLIIKGEENTSSTT